MALVLHYHPLSSYCHKVLIALYEMGLAFEPRLLNLGDPQARAEHLARWPTGKMPLLDDGGRIVPETSVIIEHLQQRNPEAMPLLPADPQACLDARLWDRLCDLYVMTPMQSLVAQRLRGQAEPDARVVGEARATLTMAYGLIDQQVKQGAWLAGPAFSLADCAAAPALFYARTIVPFDAGQPALAAYVERLLARPSVARVVDEAKPFFQYYPYKEALEPRFTT